MYVFSEFWLPKRAKETIAKLLNKSLCQLKTDVLNAITRQNYCDSDKQDPVDYLAEGPQSSVDNQISTKSLPLLRKVFSEPD